MWSGLAAESAAIEALEVFPELRRAYGDGLINLADVQPSELDEVESEPRGRTLDETIDRYPPIDDVVKATWWWAELAGQRTAPGEFRDSSASYVAPPKVGRNEPCPCGSGKKFKKCCGS